MSLGLDSMLEKAAQTVQVHDKHQNPLELTVAKLQNLTDSVPGYSHKVRDPNQKCHSLKRQNRLAHMTVCCYEGKG